MNNLEIIMNEFNQMKGEFVITEFDRIERLIAIGEDDFDYYYVTYNGRKVTWHSCVGSIIKLKDRILDNDYARLVRSAKLNHFDQFVHSDNPEAIEGAKAHMKEIETLEQPNKYLTEVIWTLE
jgi:hypothetical protein